MVFRQQYLQVIHLFTLLGFVALYMLLGLLFLVLVGKTINQGPKPQTH